jgi:hypothetical protein
LVSARVRSVSQRTNPPVDDSGRVTDVDGDGDAKSKILLD